MTYLPTRRSWLYLAIVVDLYARRIVGAACSAKVDTALVVQALEHAWQARQPKPGLLFHSDQGSTRFHRASLPAAGWLAQDRPLVTQTGSESAILVSKIT